MKTIIVMAGLSMLLSSAAVSAAEPNGFDQAMQPILTEYLKIHGALAVDKDKGVGQSAARIEKLAAKLKPSGPNASKLAAVPKNLKAAATKLRQAKGLDETREAFKGLSAPMVNWARVSNPAGVHVVKCSMAKASWLQRESQVANPYYGSKMLRCGEMAMGHHSGHDPEHHAH